MLSKEEYMNWLEKSYMNNLGPANDKVRELVRRSFRLGSTGINLGDINLGDLEKEYVELYEAMSRAYIAGIKLGTSFDKTDKDDLEEIVKDNPNGLTKNS